ncbi:MAG: hypothetical protein ACREQA_16385, partial [Candidatus Binatia bacterium]
AVLDHYLPQHNRRFAKSGNGTKPAWRQVDSKALEQALCFKYQRVVAKDNTVSFEGALFQIPKGSPCRSYAGKRVDVHVLLDGSVEFSTRERKLPSSSPKRLAHLPYIERTEVGRSPATDRKPLPQQISMNCHPDIFTLLLT